MDKDWGRVYGSFNSTGAAEGGVAHPYLINDNNTDKIIYCVTFIYMHKRDDQYQHLESQLMFFFI